MKRAEPSESALRFGESRYGYAEIHQMTTCMTRKSAPRAQGIEITCPAENARHQWPQLMKPGAVRAGKIHLYAPIRTRGGNRQPLFRRG